MKLEKLLFWAHSNRSVMPNTHSDVTQAMPINGLYKLNGHSMIAVPAMNRN